MANILYIAQFFSVDTEPGGQGQRHYQHALALSEDGHSVTVITGGGTTMCQGLRQPAAQEEQINPNLKIIRLPAAPLNQRSVFSRAKRYLDFSGKALWAGLQLRYGKKRRFNYVLGSSPPLVVAAVACLLAMLNGAAFYIEVRDLWSHTMRVNGFIRNPFLIGLNRWLENWLYRASHKIVVVSPAFCEAIDTQAPGTAHKTEYVPNGADLEFYQYPKLWGGSYLRDNAENQALFHVNYAGVYSDYTHLETLLEAAAQIQDQLPDVRFNLAGGGYQSEKLHALAQKLKLNNVKFWGTLPKNRISKFIMEGDLSVINYRALDIFGQVLPNKLFDYLAAGRPIVAAVAKGQISRVLHESKAGLTVEPGNVTALVEAIRWFYRNQEEGLRMGRQGYQYVHRHFNRKVLVERFLKLFPRVIPLQSFSGAIEARQQTNSPPRTSVKT